MAAARLVLQECSEHFKDILEKDKIVELLWGIYVDDGHNVISMLKPSMRFDVEKKTFEMNEDFSKEDAINGVSFEASTVT